MVTLTRRRSGMAKLTLPQDLLQWLFHYNEDGTLTWRNPYGRKTKPGALAGTRKKSGYVEIGIKGRLFQAHRVVYAYHTGQWPLEVDHKNRNRSDNRIDNLRPSDRSNNLANSDNVEASSGCRGVHKRSGGRTYQVRIRKNGQLIHLGSVLSPEEGSKIYEKARQEYFPNVYQV